MKRGMGKAAEGRVGGRRGESEGKVELRKEE